MPGNIICAPEEEIMITLIILESALLSDLELSSKHSDFTSHVPMHIAKLHHVTLHKQDYS